MTADTLARARARAAIMGAHRRAFWKGFLWGLVVAWVGFAVVAWLVLA